MSSQSDCHMHPLSLAWRAKYNPKITMISLPTRRGIKDFPERGLQSASVWTDDHGCGINSALLSQ
jgi:hypothetical protein